MNGDSSMDIGIVSLKIINGFSSEMINAVVRHIVSNSKKMKKT